MMHRRVRTFLARHPDPGSTYFGATKFVACILLPAGFVVLAPNVEPLCVLVLSA